MPYDNPNQNGNDYVAPTTDTGAGQVGVNSDLVANLWFGPGGMSDLNSGSGSKGTTNGDRGTRQQGGQGDGRTGKTTSLTDGFLNFGDAFASLTDKNDGNSQEPKEEGKDNNDDSSDNDSLWDMALKEIESLGQKGMDLLDKGFDMLTDGLDSLSGDAFLDAMFGEDDSLDSSDSDDSSNNDDGSGNAGSVEGHALSAAAAAAAAAASGNLSAANAINLAAIYSQLSGEIGEAIGDGNSALANQLSYAQSYVSDAMSKKDLANQMAANTIAAGGSLSALSNIMAGLSSGETGQSAINKFNPSLSQNV